MRTVRFSDSGGSTQPPLDADPPVGTPPPTNADHPLPPHEQNDTRE